MSVSIALKAYPHECFPRVNFYTRKWVVSNEVLDLSRPGRMRPGKVVLTCQQGKKKVAFRKTLSFIYSPWWTKESLIGLEVRSERQQLFRTNFMNRGLRMLCRKLLLNWERKHLGVYLQRYKDQELMKSITPVSFPDMIK